MISYIVTFIGGLIIGEISTVLILALCKHASDDDEREGR